MGVSVCVCGLAWVNTDMKANTAFGVNKRPRRGRECEENRLANGEVRARDKQEVSRWNGGVFSHA